MAKDVSDLSLSRLPPTVTISWAADWAYAAQGLVGPRVAVEPHPLVDPPCRRCSVSGNDSRWTSPLFRLLLADSITALSYGRPFSDGDLSMRWRTRFRGPHKNVQHSVANPCIPASFSAAPLWCRNCARCTCVGAAAHPKAVFGAFWTSAAAGVRHARCDLSTRILLPPQSLRGALQRCGLLPGPPRSAADARHPCSACRPICLGRGVGCQSSRRPARADIPTELSVTSRCRPEFCGDVARAARPGQQPRDA